MRKDKFDALGKGLCPFCLKVVKRPKRGKIGTCSCDKGKFNFHIAHILLQEALQKGVNAIQDGIIGELPAEFKVGHATMIKRLDLLDRVRLEEIEKVPRLCEAAIEDGTKGVRWLIEAKCKEIKKEYKIEISSADAATIIACRHIMREHEAHYGDLDRIVIVQNPDNLEKNEKGEFVLSYQDMQDRWHRRDIESEDYSITACQPDVKVRYEKDGDNILAYIKCKMPTFVVAYKSYNFPPNSCIYIFHREEQIRLG